MNQRSLRSLLVVTAGPVLVLALLVSAMLVGITTALDQASGRIASSVESVRLAEEAEIALLLHERAEDPIMKSELESRLRRLLTEARAHVTSREEPHVLDRAELHVDAYLRESHAPKSAATLSQYEGRAYRALEDLVNLNVKQARELQSDVTRWDGIANVVGIGTAILVLVLAAALVLALRRAVDPVFSIADAMTRFAAGDHAVRVKEVGPSELRVIASRFNAMADALSAQREAQVAFLGGVAHDLRNPLAALKLSLSRRGGASLELVKRQITRLERMIGDFLDVSKIESGTLELDIARTDARQLVKHVAELFEDTSESHHIVTSVPEDAILVQCDALRIEQVLANLLSNAIKYSPRGGDVFVSLDFVDNAARISVRDQGIGIAREDLARVFEPFRRVGLSREAIPGVGLGLFVVKKIVEAHGGHIEVESEVGKGTTFTVLLPLALATEVEAQQQPPAP